MCKYEQFLQKSQKEDGCLCPGYFTTKHTDRQATHWKENAYNKTSNQWKRKFGAMAEILVLSKDALHSVINGKKYKCKIGMEVMTLFTWSIFVPLDTSTVLICTLISKQHDFVNFAESIIYENEPLILCMQLAAISFGQVPLYSYEPNQ